MGGAGREGFCFPEVFQDSAQDGHIGHSYCDMSHHEGGASRNGYCHFNSMCVSAGRGQKWGRITEKVTDYTRASEMQFAQAKHMDRGVHEANQAEAKDKRAASPGGHNDGVMQRASDGCTAVTGHRGEKEALSDAHKGKTVHLDEAVQVLKHACWKSVSCLKF